MPMTKHRYRIESCCGSIVDSVVLDLPDEANPEAFEDDAVEAAGYDTERCESCGSANYSGHYEGVEVVDDDDEQG